MNNPLVEETEIKKAMFMNFENILHDAKMVQQIASFLKIKMSAQEALAIHTKTLNADTKTKAVSISVDRDALWTKAACKLFEKSEFPSIISLAQKQGMHL